MDRLRPVLGTLVYENSYCDSYKGGFLRGYFSPWSKAQSCSPSGNADLTQYGIAGFTRYPFSVLAMRQRLLHGVQSLIDEHAGQHQQEHSRTGAEHPDRDGEPVDFHEQFGLLFSHVRARVVEIQLLILVHGKRDPVDEA